jgi:hypothetical protein
MSKGKSSIRQKLEYQRKQPYTPGQRMNYRACPCDGKKVFPGAILDIIEDQKLSGGFNTKRSNQCQTCFQVKSVNGACAC